jgi:hypothetical protein
MSGSRGSNHVSKGVCVLCRGISFGEVCALGFCTSPWQSLTDAGLVGCHFLSGSKCVGVRWAKGGNTALAAGVHRRHRTEPSAQEAKMGASSKWFRARERVIPCAVRGE